MNIIFFVLFPFYIPSRVYVEGRPLSTDTGEEPTHETLFWSASDSQKLHSEPFNVIQDYHPSFPFPPALWY